MQRVSATAASPAEASEMPQQRDHGHALLAESNNAELVHDVQKNCMMQKPDKFQSTSVESHRSLSGTASPVPVAKTETPSRASHAGVPASRGEAPAAAETRSDRRQSRGKGPRGPEADRRRGHGMRGAEVWSRAYESESEMAVAMETAERRRGNYSFLSVRASVLRAGGR
jgi:hypothetical protein